CARRLKWDPYFDYW
nr:immunoglobulin heavy chain junction region [Mus musculus]